MSVAQASRVHHRSRAALSGEPRFVRGEPAGLQLKLIKGETREEGTLRVVRDGSRGEQVR
jgi:hypothetical protein